MVRELLHKGLVSEALRLLQSEAQAFPGEGFTDRVEQCSTEFRYMADFMLQGYSDPRRGELYAELTQRILYLWHDIRVRKEILEMPYIKGLKKTLLSNDASVEALQSQLMRESSVKEHHEVLSMAFLSLFTSFHWNRQQAEEWQMFLTSPQANPIDAATLIGAISLSCMIIFSKEKATCLAEIYCTANGAARQRAFVGCVLALCHADTAQKDDVEAVLDVLFRSPDAARDLTEMQMQMASCANADKDSSEIRNKLMPDILKNQPFKITSKGIVEREEEDDILDPDASERRMELMERSMKRMLKMQKDGADIFFEGFSQMKRYPFFYKMANWFMPFYMQHPDIVAYVSKITNSDFVERVTERGPFCNSDKYSFVIAMSGVMRHLPDNVREMINAGEVGPLGMHKDKEDMNDPSLLRLQYLQDLYRFFRLNPMATGIYNPYGETSLCKPWTIAAKRIDNKELRDMCAYLIKKGDEESMKKAVPKLLNAFEDKECMERLYCIAEYRMRRKEYATAAEYYAKCLKMKRDHTAAMRGIAKACYESGDYAKAAFYFDALHTLYPERLSYTLNFAMAMVKDGKAGEVTKELYRLEFENPEDETIRNTLGWALLYAGKAEQALAMYRRFDAGSADFSVVLNLAYALLFTGDIQEAIKTLRSNSARFTVDGGEDYPTLLLNAMREDADLLTLYGFGKAELAVIASQFEG